MIGSLPLFFGLAVVVPVLGHSTWHLYRKVVEPDPTRQDLPRSPTRRRYAAQFPAALFTGEGRRALTIGARRRATRLTITPQRSGRAR